MPDGHDERLLRSLVTVVDATSLVMPGYDLNKRAYEAVDQHALTTTGRLAVSALAGEARALESMCEYAMDEHDHRHGTVDDRRRVEALRAARRVQHGDLSWRWRGFRLGPDDRLGIDEYLRGLIDWRFDSDAVPEYWEHRARLTERVLGLNQDELFTLLVTGIGESPCRPPYESRNLSGYLEVPEEFGKPMYRAREAGLFELAELLYREGLYEYLRALITSMYPEAALWSTSLRALWALGLAEEIPTRATAWGDDF